LTDKLRVALRDNFSLDMMSVFSIIFEGWTDVSYVEHALKLYAEKNGVDLLRIPPKLVEAESARIGIYTPGKPGNPTRGGIPQMVRLADLLHPYVFTLEMFLGVLFVFDHDVAGQEAVSQVQGFGFRPDINIITLDPKWHPKACAKKQVCIEDLLSLSIQSRFFDEGTSTCSVEYENGVRRRFVWGHDSKPYLRDFVVTHANLDDMIEVVGLVKRARRAFGFPD
jgi:hypothetical protein